MKPVVSCRSFVHPKVIPAVETIQIHIRLAVDLVARIGSRLRAWAANKERRA